MDIKLFYKTQRELATALNTVVDYYWEEKISENDLIIKVEELFLNNKKKVRKDNGFTTILKQQCGKRRLEIIERILSLKGHIEVVR
ncbi:TIGR04540 family protein [Pseudalkalibacillus decolorationis]|uniref:TIGR04540 family protein n=1 Tax=Pseudalkalibacillus decolorationis TaxID=163879 RepID=UPI00214791CC|nr:TIGR04540 family protein [Pseudalkalibacillus decolorationis]